MSERTRTAYDKWARSYDSDPNPQLVLEHDEVLTLIGAKPGEQVLDAACGTGRYAAEIAKAGANVCGIDFSEEMLTIARAKLPKVEFRLADLNTRLPFTDDVFDGIVCAQALKHLPNLLVPMQEFARVLKVGGRLVFSVTHPEMNWQGYEMRQNPEFVLPEHADIHHHRFADYFVAIDSASLAIERIQQVPVSEKIRHLLTEESFQIVEGRFQVVVFRLRKSVATQGLS